MGIDLPEPLRWLFKLTGSEWPDADEDKIARFGDQVGRFSGHIDDVNANLINSVRLANGSGSGPAMTQYTDNMRDVVNNGMPGMSNGARAMAAEIHDAALQVEYSKGTAVINMAIMAPMIASAIANAPETFGATMAIAEAGIAAVRVTVPRLLTAMVEKVVTNTVMMEAGDLAVQGYQVLIKRDRAAFDSKLSLNMIEMGAVGGAVDGALTAALMKGAPKFWKAASAGETDANKLIWAPPKWANMGTQVANNTVTSLIMAGINHQPIDGLSLLQGAALGAAMGGLHHNPGAKISSFGDGFHMNEDFLNGDSWVRPNGAYEENKSGDNPFSLNIRTQPPSADGGKTVWYSDPNVTHPEGTPPLPERLGSVIDKSLENHPEGVPKPQFTVLENVPPTQLDGIRNLAAEKGVSIVVPHGTVAVDSHGSLHIPSSENSGGGGFRMVHPDGSVEDLGSVYDTRKTVGEPVVGGEPPETNVSLSGSGAKFVSKNVAPEGEGPVAAFADSALKQGASPKSIHAEGLNLSDSGDLREYRNRLADEVAAKNTDTRPGSSVLLGELSPEGARTVLDRLGPPKASSGSHIDALDLATPTPSRAEVPHTDPVQELNNRFEQEPGTVLSALADHYSSENNEGMAKLATYAKAKVDDGGGVPQHKDLLDYAIREHSLDETPLGREVLPAVAHALDLDVVVVSGDKPAFHLNGDSPERVYVHRVSTEDGQDHYRALRPETKPAESKHEPEHDSGTPHEPEPEHDSGAPHEPALAAIPIDKATHDQLDKLTPDELTKLENLANTTSPEEFQRLSLRASLSPGSFPEAALLERVPGLQSRDHVLQAVTEAHEDAHAFATIGQHQADVKIIKKSLKAMEKPKYAAIRDHEGYQDVIAKAKAVGTKTDDRAHLAAVNDLHATVTKFNDSLPLDQQRKFEHSELANATGQAFARVAIVELRLRRDNGAFQVHVGHEFAGDEARTEWVGKVQREYTERTDDVMWIRNANHSQDTNLKPAIDAMMKDPDPRYFTVALHGSPGSVHVADGHLSVKEMATLIHADPAWSQNKKPVRLFSCYTGMEDHGFAHELAKELGVDVIAPNDKAWANRDGETHVSENLYTYDDTGAPKSNPVRKDPDTGAWRRFTPDGKVALEVPPGGKLGRTAAMTLVTRTFPRTEDEIKTWPEPARGPLRKLANVLATSDTLFERHLIDQHMNSMRDKLSDLLDEETVRTLTPHVPEHRGDIHEILHHLSQNDTVEQSHEAASHDAVAFSPGAPTAKEIFTDVTRRLENDEHVWVRDPAKGLRALPLTLVDGVPHLGSRPMRAKAMERLEVATGFDEPLSHDGPGHVPDSSVKPNGNQRMLFQGASLMVGHFTGDIVKVGKNNRLGNQHLTIDKALPALFTELATQEPSNVQTFLARIHHERTLAGSTMTSEGYVAPANIHFRPAAEKQRSIPLPGWLGDQSHQADPPPEPHATQVTRDVSFARFRGFIESRLTDLNVPESDRAELMGSLDWTASRFHADPDSMSSADRDKLFAGLYLNDGERLDFSKMAVSLQRLSGHEVSPALTLIIRETTEQTPAVRTSLQQLHDDLPAGSHEAAAIKAVLDHEGDLRPAAPPLKDAISVIMDHHWPTILGWMPEPASGGHDAHAFAPIEAHGADAKKLAESLPAMEDPKYDAIRGHAGYDDVIAKATAIATQTDDRGHLAAVNDLHAEITRFTDSLPLDQQRTFEHSELVGVTGQAFARVSIVELRLRRDDGAFQVHIGHDFAGDTDRTTWVERVQRSRMTRDDNVMWIRNTKHRPDRILRPAIDAMMKDPDTRYFTVAMHGSPGAVHVGEGHLSVKEMATLLRADPSWSQNQKPVRLFSCYTGMEDHGFAHELAKELGVDVIAPNDKAWADSKGNTHVSENLYTYDDTGKPVSNPVRKDPDTGAWRRFSPDGGVALELPPGEKLGHTAAMTLLTRTLPRGEDEIRTWPEATHEPLRKLANVLATSDTLFERHLIDQHMNSMRDKLSGILDDETVRTLTAHVPAHRGDIREALHQLSPDGAAEPGHETAPHDAVAFSAEAPTSAEILADVTERLQNHEAVWVRDPVVSTRALPLTLVNNVPHLGGRPLRAKHLDRLEVATGFDEPLSHDEPGHVPASFVKPNGNQRMLFQGASLMVGHFTGDIVKVGTQNRLGNQHLTVDKALPALFTELATQEPANVQTFLARIHHERTLASSTMTGNGYVAPANIHFRPATSKQRAIPLPGWLGDQARHDNPPADPHPTEVTSDVSFARFRGFIESRLTDLNVPESDRAELMGSLDWTASRFHADPDSMSSADRDALFAGLYLNDGERLDFTKMAVSLQRLSGHEVPPALTLVIRESSPQSPALRDSLQQLHDSLPAGSADAAAIKAVMDHPGELRPAAPPLNAAISVITEHHWPTVLGWMPEPGHDAQAFAPIEHHTTDAEALGKSLPFMDDPKYDTIRDHAGYSDLVARATAVATQTDDRGHLAAVNDLHATVNRFADSLPLDQQRKFEHSELFNATGQAFARVSIVELRLRRDSGTSPVHIGRDFASDTARTTWVERVQRTHIRRDDNVMWIRNPQHKPDLNLKRAIDAMMKVPDTRYFTVALHGSPGAVHVGEGHLSVKEVAALLRSDPSWSQNQKPVRLFSCYTGMEDHGFAHELARELGVDVIAPNDKAWSDAKGNTHVSENLYTYDDTGAPVSNPARKDPETGAWRRFTPDGTVALELPPNSKLGRTAAMTLLTRTLPRTENEIRTWPEAAHEPLRKLAGVLATSDTLFERHLIDQHMNSMRDKLSGLLDDETVRTLITHVPAHRGDVREALHQLSPDTHGPDPSPEPAPHDAVAFSPEPTPTPTPTRSATYYFAPPAADPHTWSTHSESAPQRIETFDDTAHATSFLSRFGTGHGSTLHLHDDTTPGAVDEARAARALVPDSHGRYTVAAHGDSGHVTIGGHELGPKAFAQVVREHPDWEKIQRSGLRLVICDAGAASADGEHPFAQQVADELGIHVVAPTAKVFSSHDGVAMVAEPDPLRPGFPKYSAQGVFHDFAPANEKLSEPVPQHQATGSVRQPTAYTPIPDATHHPAEAALTDSAHHPRWQRDLVQWSPPYDPAARATLTNTLIDPLVPWYNRPGATGGTHALGDLSVVSTDRPHDAAAQSHTLLENLKTTTFTDAAGADTGISVSGHISPRLARDLEHQVKQALETTDPRVWEKHLRSGITVGDGDTVLRVRFRLTGEAEAPKAKDPDPVLREFLSKYGDIAHDQTAVREDNRGLGFVAEYMKAFASKLSSLTIMVRPSIELGSKTMHSLAHEVQLGSRATNGARVGVAHQVRIEIEAHTTDGHTATAAHDVTGKPVTAAYPAAYGKGTPVGGERVVTATRPQAMERYDYTVGAVDTKPLEDAYLKALIGPGKVPPQRAAEVVHGAAEEVVDEKSFRDRAQAVFTDSLPANFTHVRGFAGYTGLKAELVSVERVENTTDGGIRNDIAETVTVKHTTEHGQGVGIKVGPEFGFVDGVTATVDAFEGGMSSKHSTGTQVQGQAKTAVVHDGDKVRYKAVFRVTGRIDADRRLQSDLTKSPSVVVFHADVTGELMVPAHQSAAFERDIAGAAPQVPVPARARLTPAGAARAATVGHQKTYQKLLKLSSREPSPFPRGGLTDGHDNHALYNHLRYTGGQAAVHVPPNHVFTPHELGRLHTLQTTGGVRVFEVPADAGGQHRELTITANPHPAPGEAWLTTAWADTTRATAFSQSRGYHLDAQGVAGAWTGHGSARPNPARTTARPVRETPPVEHLHTVSDLVSRGTPDGTAPHDLGLVAPSRPGPGLGASLATMGADPHLHVTNLTSEHDILGHQHLPDEGYVVNPAGHVVWGWREGGSHSWGSTGAERHEALVDLTRQAGRTGLQLVVPRGSRFETELQSAADALRPADWQHDPQALGDRRDLQNRISAARENDGAGLDALSGDDLLKMLVSDRSVRIVDEHGIATHALNTRETVREVVQRDGAGAVIGRPVVVVSDKHVDTSLRLGEERAIRTADGRPLRTVTWKDDGTQTSYVRRAVHESDPRKETPELVSGTGLGSAAVKEMPRAEEIHAAARSLITDLSSNMKRMRRGLSATDPNATARHDNHPARLRYRLDKQLQLALGVPRLRGARGRGFDAGHQEEVTFRGRKYQISVEQVMLDRPQGDVPSEADVAVDHQTKGTRGGGASSARSWEVGTGAGISGRVELPHGGAIDLGDFSGGVSGGRTHSQSDGTASKNYSRLRAPKGEAFRPEYGARFQVTVTEARSRFGFTSRRTMSRIIDGDGATLPALVPSAFRPDTAHAATPAYVEAHKAVTANIGRTSVLSRAEHQDLKNHPDAIDFSKSGTDGLHATFAGLDKAVRSSALFVIGQARAAHPEVPASAWRHPSYVAEVERALSEGFLRSNHPRLLGESGIPIPLPKEFHWGLGLPNYERSFTVKGFLLRADPAAGHHAPSAANESYAEHDLKQTDSTSTHLDYKVSGTVGGAYRHNVDSGGKTSATKRGVADQVGAAVGAEASGVITSHTESTTKGSIDVSLLTENTGQEFSRAHLVLEVTSNRQPVDAGMINGFLGRHLRPSAYDTTPKSHYLLVEHAAELSMSTTLHHDLSTLHGDATTPPAPAHLDPPPKPNQPLHLTRHDAAMAAGFATQFDDRAAVFLESGPKHPGGPVTLQAGTGILGAIKHGLQTTGSVGDEHLTDASDIWRSISHKFDPGELKTHPDDLFETGVTHRAEFPGPLGSTTQVTVRVTAERVDTDHLRPRDRGAVTFGGQSLKQQGQATSSGHSFSVFGKVEGQFTATGHSGGAADLSARWTTGVEKSTGSEAVIRDIRRTTAAVRPKGGPTPPRVSKETAQQTKDREDRTPTAGDGEEFAHKLNLKIEIFVGHENPEPLARLANTSVSATPPRPAVTLRTGPGADGGPTHITMRNVVPHHFADDGPPPAVPAVPAPQPIVRATRPGEQTTPSTLDHELAEHLQGLTFPDLGHVASWAPAVTLSKDKAAPFLDGSGTGLHGTQAPPHLGRYAPHNDLGVRLNTSLAKRNVRDNTPELFRGAFELPSPNGEPVRMAAHIEGVIRPVGNPAKYNGLTFTERADEPTFQESKSSGWSTDASLGGKTKDGAGIPGGSSGRTKGVETEANIGDYVEYNRSYGQTSHIYGGKVSYLLSGSHDWSMRIDSGKDFEGLLPEGWAVELAQNHPTQVVHPLARPLSGNGAARAKQIRDLIGNPPPNDAPHRLVADLDGTASAADHLRAARHLALASGRPVDLALVHYTGGKADHLEHHVFDPADAVHQDAANDAAQRQTMAAQRPTREQDLLTAQNNRDQADQRNAPVIRHGRIADQNLLVHLAAHPGDLQQRVTDLDQAHQRAQEALTNAGQPPAPELVRAEQDARAELDAARKTLANRTRLETTVTNLAPAVAAAHQDNRNAQQAVDAAQDRITQVTTAETRAKTSNAASVSNAHIIGNEQTALAEHRDDLSGLAPRDALDAAWQRTPSGFALPRDNADLANAMHGTQHRDTLTISIGGAPTATGDYSIRGSVTSRDRLASDLIDKLAESSSTDPIPRRIFLSGDDSAALAQAITAENQRRTTANQALPADTAPAAVLPPIDVIGIRGTVTHLNGGGGWTDWVAGLGDRVLNQGADTPGLIVYRDGQPLRLAPYPDLASLLAAFDAPPKLPHRPWTGVRS